MGSKLQQRVLNLLWMGRRIPGIVANGMYLATWLSCQGAPMIPMIRSHGRFVRSRKLRSAAPCPCDLLYTPPEGGIRTSSCALH